MTIGQLILGRLEAMGRTQADLVRELDRIGTQVTRQSVNQWCTNKAKPELGHMLALWQALGVAPDDRQTWLDAMARPRAENAA